MTPKTTKKKLAKIMTDSEILELSQVMCSKVWWIQRFGKTKKMLDEYNDWVQKMPNKDFIDMQQLFAVATQLIKLETQRRLLNKEQ